MDNGYVYLPVYAFYLAGIIFLLMILILVSLLYVLLCKILRMNKSYRLRDSIPDEQQPKPKTSSFHIPKIRFSNKFERLSTCSEGRTSPRSSNTPEDHNEQSNENKIVMKKEQKSCTVSVKNEIPDPIAIIPREKMAALCDAILNNKDRKVNLRKLEKFEIRNNIVYQINERKSFANLKCRSTSVPDLEIYDVVHTIHPVELKTSTDFENSNDFDQSTVEICKIGFDNEDYKCPRMLKKETYENANIFNQKSSS